MTLTLASAPLELQSLKLYLLDLTGLGKDALHVYTGMAIFIIVRLAWRWRGGWYLAWLAALSVAVGIEWLDIRAEGQLGMPQPDPAHWHDVWNTMVWPTILMLVGRWLHPRQKAKVSGDLVDQPFEESPPV